MLSAADVLESMEEAFYAIDRDWRFLYVNRGAEAFWQREREMLLGRSMLEVFPAFPNSESHQAHLRAMATGERLRVETISTATGSPVELNLQPTAWGLSVYFRDITERHRLEKELKDRAEILELAEQSAGIGVWDIDLASQVVRGTSQFFRLYGLPHQEQGVALDCMRELRHPDDLVGVVDGFRHALETGRDTYEVEYRIIRPDGQTRWIFGRGHVVRDSVGRAIRYGGIDIDVTDRKRSGEDSQRLASIVESSDDAIISKDMNGIVMSWNRGAEKLYGYKAEEIIGRPITLVIPEDRLEEEPRTLASIGRGERIDHYETVRRRKDGSMVDISLTVSPVTDARGRIIGASKIARDITDRKAAQARQALLLREMSHRVKNVFALAGGIVALSSRNAVDATEMAKKVSERFNALASAHQLTLSDASDMEREKQATTLFQLAETITSPYRGGDDNRIHVHGPIVEIRGNAITSLALLMHEFATNAAKYGALSSAEGNVEIDWSIDGDVLKFTWTETNGPSISGVPHAEGFGSQLARRTAAQVEGTVSWDWLPDGLAISLAIPLAHLAR